MGCFSSKEEEESSSWMCQIDDDYLASTVSYYGLNEKIENFSKALKVVKGNVNFLENLSTSEKNKVLEEARKLYGLLHARYICTADGAEDMREKYETGLFGQCPRVSCHHQNLLPVGLSDKIGEGTVKTFCPRCFDIYETNQKIDGAFFGPDFPTYFIKANKIKISSYKKENWVNSGNDAIDKRLKRWPEANK